ncbi:MAG: hypothetical protein ABIC57_00410 [bacterium]
MVFIIPAGGQGEKLWPYSRKDFPKTFQKLFGDRSLMRRIVDTLLKIAKPSDIYISTKGMYLDVVTKDIPEIPKENYLIEPNFFKNRGPGEGYAFMMLTIIRPDEPFMIVQPDCIREPEEKFLEMIKEMEKLVTRDKKFISGGIPAINTELGTDRGVDYLILGEKINLNTNLEVYSVKQYVSREDTSPEALKTVKENKVSAHSNHNCWYPELMMAAYKKYRPDWYDSLMKIKSYVGKPNEKSAKGGPASGWEKTNEIYETMEPGATEEVTKHVFKDGYIINHAFKWYDMGTWESVYLYLNKDGKYKPEGNTVSIDTKGTLVKTHGNKLVATLGVKGLVIVETDDVVLVADRKKVGDMKLVLEKIKEEKKDKYL